MCVLYTRQNSSYYTIHFCNGSYIGYYTHQLHESQPTTACCLGKQTNLNDVIRFQIVHFAASLERRVQKMFQKKKENMLAAFVYYRPKYMHVIFGMIIRAFVLYARRRINSSSLCMHVQDAPHCQPSQTNKLFFFPLLCVIHRSCCEKKKENDKMSMQSKFYPCISLQAYTILYFSDFCQAATGGSISSFA